jgi:hypothetical protein
VTQGPQDLQTQEEARLNDFETEGEIQAVGGGRFSIGASAGADGNGALSATATWLHVTSGKVGTTVSIERAADESSASCPEIL